jgi:hypothetical protein
MIRPLAALLLAACACCADPVVEVASLTYGAGKASKCFSSAFLEVVATETGIATNRAFVTIAAGDAAAMARTPFALMTGEGAFTLSAGERATLKGWMERGGFLVASAGCSSKDWSASFRREIETMFGADTLVGVKADHPVFHTVFDLTQMPLKSNGRASFEGVMIDGRLACVFSHEGLNDTGKVDGCCCCGGNEIKNARQVVANALVYALVE